MSITGIGIDIVLISRIQTIISSKLEVKFSKKILSQNELNNLQYSTDHKVFLAKSFAVKEAASKALGIGIRNGLQFNHFELYYNNLGKPNLKLLEKAKEMANRMNIKNIHVSISKEKLYLCAIVILEK